LRNSGGLKDGGCFRGYRAIGAGMGTVWASDGCDSIEIAAVAYGRDDRSGIRLMRRIEVTAFEGGCSRGGILKI
jgi:hypothetical protein